MMIRIQCLLALVMFVASIGCNKPQTTDVDSGKLNPAEDAHDHDEKASDHSVAGHSHGAGPHDGTIADWGGGKYHVEFTVDHDTQTATVYILGSDEKTPTPIAAKSIALAIKDPAIELALEASPQTGDPDGSASRFVGTHEKLGTVKEYSGTLTGVIDDTPYSGDFDEHSHAGHDH